MCVKRERERERTKGAPCIIPRDRRAVQSGHRVGVGAGSGRGLARKSCEGGSIISCHTATLSSLLIPSFHPQRKHYPDTSAASSVAGCNGIGGQSRTTTVGGVL